MSQLSLDNLNGNANMTDSLVPSLDANGPIYLSSLYLCVKLSLIKTKVWNQKKGIKENRQHRIVEYYL